MIFIQQQSNEPSFTDSSDIHLVIMQEYNFKFINKLYLFIAYVYSNNQLSQ